MRHVTSTGNSSDLDRSGQPASKLVNWVWLTYMISVLNTSSLPVWVKPVIISKSSNLISSNTVNYVDMLTVPWLVSSSQGISKLFSSCWVLFQEWFGPLLLRSQILMSTLEVLGVGWEAVLVCDMVKNWENLLLQHYWVTLITCYLCQSWSTPTFWWAKGPPKHIVNWGRPQIDFRGLLQFASIPHILHDVLYHMPHVKPVANWGTYSTKHLIELTATNADRLVQ